jgi:oligoribonuclease NrnB/cAMP/cGMP phosphodiesterase (DHH superfamily)
MSTSRPLVIYHQNCIDGFTAAWIAWKTLDNAKLLPAKYGDSVNLDLVTGRDVYIVDFSYSKEDLVGMYDYVRSLKVLDHHKTAQENCEGLEEFCVFDMEKSGCMLAWEFFQGPEPVPSWIRCVDDRDLWKFELGATRLVHAFMSSFPFKLSHWDAFDAMPLNDMVQAGNHIQRSTDNEIQKNMEEARYGILQGYAIVALNVPYLHRSETCHEMLASFPNAEIAITFFQRADRKWQYDLRARKEDNVDVSEVAKRYLGGGNAKAAGFMTDELLEQLR